MAEDSERQELVAAHLRQSRKRLAAAHLLFAQREWEDAISRAYYAAFHAVTAALASRDLEAKTHTGARTLFALHFVRTGEVQADIARTLDALLRDRQSGDYDAYPLLTAEDADGALHGAEAVIAAVRRVLGLPDGE